MSSFLVGVCVKTPPADWYVDKGGELSHGYGMGVKELLRAAGLDQRHHQGEEQQTDHT